MSNELPLCDHGLSRQRLRAGLRVGFSLGTASFLLAVSFGAITQSQGWAMTGALLCSMVVFSASAQFALVSTLGAGGGVASAVVAAALVNARFLPMGVSVATALRGGRLRRAAEAQAVVDGSWAAAHLGGGRFDRWVLFTASAVQWVLWVTGTVAGAVLAPSPHLQTSLGLDVVAPVMFLFLLLDAPGADRPYWTSALLGGAVAAGLSMFLPAGPALIGAACVSLVALARPLPKEDRGEAYRGHAGEQAGTEPR
ncbi:AzlC family ABC transporter permease [Streptomyces albus subsp. chlorinus]|uniref:AzlC family ABC transporter permease n=1 Tax=Streptomyces albus TaxID=1888 RepID=UPI001570F0B7|nr:AzlC family ABC transporter permease [Streptomyces albus]NSC20422.1 AzlC family ABC transporter permease [Streptomyces albus subsp. chlorinus]